MDRHATINTHSIYMYLEQSYHSRLKGMTSTIASLRVGWLSWTLNQSLHGDFCIFSLFIEHSSIHKNSIDITLFVHTPLHSIPYRDAVPFVQLCCNTCGIAFFCPVLVAEVLHCYFAIFFSVVIILLVCVRQASRVIPQLEEVDP